jgi:Fe-S-cluster containining protein
VPNKKTQTGPITACIRCGTCCQKGGPSLHIEDKPLIEKRRILIKHLYTIREGELSYDNIQERRLPAATDIIKVKGRKDSWTCRFLDENQNQCRIYKFRPAECRALKCWDTRDIEEMYSKNRLTRQDLIATVEGLWDLIEEHQRRCSYETLQNLLSALDGGKNNKALEDISFMVRYDMEIRSLAVEKGGLDPEMTDFLFGRPLKDTVRMYGFKIVQNDDNYQLIPENK